MMLDVISKYWVTWACGIIAVVIAAFWKRVVAWYKTKKEKEEADAYADRYVLFLKLRELFKVAQEQGYITIDDLQEAEITYKHYHVLGGNGKATKMIQVLRELEVK